MNEIKQFLKLLTVCKRRLLIEHFSSYFHMGLLLVGVATVLTATIARVTPIMYFYQSILILAGSIMLFTIIVAYFKKPNNTNAAVVFDHYVAEDRVKTALSYLKDESSFSQLQRRDALSHMKESLPEIEKSQLKLFYWKKLLISLLLFALAGLSLIFPNDVMETAKQKETDKKIAEEAKKEIEKLVDDETVSEQIEELKKETADIDKSKELLAKLLEKEAGLEEMKQDARTDEQRLQKLADGLDEFDELQAALNEVDSEKMKQALKQLSEELPALSKQQQQDLEKLLSDVTGEKASGFAEMTEEEREELLGALEEQLGTLIENAGSLNQLAISQEQLQQLATSLNQSITNTGISNSGKLSFASQTANNQGDNGQTSSGNNNNSNGQEQDEEGQDGEGQDGQGQGSGNGSGSGSGNGSGAGNGSGSGSGSGSGNGGSGAGSGSGAGFGQGSRELMIPEKIDGEESIENDLGALGEGSGEQQLAPEAPVLKGNVRSYEEVYGNYERTYRESVERMDLPAYLEDAVKEYFSELNPEGE
ncbi:hypothetical protein [Bacillus sp. SD088]|uniref:hypothetical protein n=1 Tax=Bacillus sp. SD088 TaxID=2782012 RepID=UPI001A9626E6|nr:hypothetical protein [Bacillus sp. SD088]MBO0994696.1 hypothetical protein [Bacillus sp. SD088]